MKIVFLMTQSLDDPSGLGRFEPLGQELAKLGHQVSLFALNPFREQRNDSLQKSNITVQYVAPMHVIKDDNLKIYYPSYKLPFVVLNETYQLSKAALVSSADIVQVCKAHPMNGIAGILARYIQGKNLCVDCDDYEAASGNFSAGWQKKVIAFFERYIPRHAKLVSTNTWFMYKKLVSWGVQPDRLIYIPNGVDLKRFTPVTPKVLERIRMGLNLRGLQVIAYVGSLSLASHPIDLLLNAFSIVNDKLPQTVLLIVGGGEDIHRLKQQAQNLGISGAVRFVGRVPPNEVSRYYQVADVSVDPVRDDEVAYSRSPLKLFESWASGTPFVTGDAGDRRLLLGFPPSGLLAKPGDEESLAECLYRILTEPELAANLSRLGLIKVQEFTWNHLAYQLETAYKTRLLVE